MEWSPAARQARLQAETLEAVSRLSDARVKEVASEEDEPVDVTAVSEEEDDAEEECQEEPVAEPAVQQAEQQSEEEKEPAEPAVGAVDEEPVDLSVGANPRRCFPSLAPASRRTSVIAHTTTVPKKRAYYRRNLLPGGKFHLDSPPPAAERPKDLRVPRTGLAPVQNPLGSGNNPLSPTPGSPYRGGGGGGRGGGGQGGGGGLGPPGFGGFFGPGAGGNFGFGLMNCKTEQQGDAGGRGRHSPRHFQPPHGPHIENFPVGYIDQQVEGCKPPPQPPPQWAAQAQTGPRMAPAAFGYGADPFGNFSDPYDQLDAELFGSNAAGEHKPPVSAASIGDGNHDLFGLEQLLQPAGGGAELSQQTVAEALGEPAALPALSEPVVSSCLADAMYDGKFVVTGLAGAPQLPTVHTSQAPEASAGGAPSRTSPGPIRGGRCSPRSPRSVCGDSADGSPSLDARVAMLQQRVSADARQTAGSGV